MTSAKVRAIVEQLKTLTLAETTELIALIETTFGVNAAPLQLKLQPPAPVELAPAATVAVILEAMPAHKRAAALKVVWQASGSSLKQAKALVKSLPSIIQPAAALEDARDLKQALEAFGATVSLKAAS